MEIKGLRVLAIAALALALVQDSYQQLPINCSPGQTALNGVNIPPFSPGDMIFSSDCSSLTLLLIFSFPQSTFPAGILDSLTALESLRILNAGVGEFEAGAFSALEQLENIELRMNALTAVDGLFDGLTSLTNLDLDNNMIGSLPAGVFDDLGALGSLRVQNNGLSNIEGGVFSSLTSVSELFLSNNMLTTLPEDAFQGLGAVTLMGLADNNFDTLPFEVFSPLTSLGFVFFGVGPDLECAPPLPSGIFLGGPPPCFAPPPSTFSPPPAQVVSDPHFRGFQGQEFDVVGRAGSIYSLIEDSSFTLRSAKFAKSFEWVGAKKTPLDNEEDDSKTWISEIGLANNPGHSIFIGVLDASVDDNLGFSRNIDAVFKAGVVKVDGAPISRVGTISLENEDGEGSNPTLIALENHNSFGRVTITAPAIALQVDVVLPRKEWQIAEAEYGLYSHINLNFISINLTPTASGILGDTQFQEFTFAHGDEEKYEVESIL